MLISPCLGRVVLTLDTIHYTIDDFVVFIVRGESVSRGVL